MPENWAITRGYREVNGEAIGRWQRDWRKCPSNLFFFFFLLCKLIEELGSSDFLTPATPPVLCLFLGFISEFDRGQK